MDVPIAVEEAPGGERAWLEALYLAGDWGPLIGASRRALFEGYGGELERLLLASAYHRTGRRAEAEEMFQALVDGPLRSDVLLQWADVSSRRDPWLALAWLDRHEASFPDPGGWRAGAQARLYLRVGDIDAARAHLPRHDLLPLHVPRRHPWLGALSSAVVPGLGQLISGQPVEAASALAVVGTLAGCTAWAATGGRGGTAAVIGTVGGLFWIGSVYGGADAAVRFNRHQVHLLEDSLDRGGLPGASPPPFPGEVEAGEVEAGEVEAGEVEAGEVEAGEVEAG
ncbi:MAG TPA: hypothetical protein ENK18_24215, partial [Deltaproteobacteria bacterium]|nr:hypothetical protein [Deltaproteobacteria bacterium]